MCVCVDQHCIMCVRVMLSHFIAIYRVFTLIPQKEHIIDRRSASQLYQLSPSPDLVITMN